MSDMKHLKKWRAVAGICSLAGSALAACGQKTLVEYNQSGGMDVIDDLGGDSAGQSGSNGENRTDNNEAGGTDGNQSGGTGTVRTGEWLNTSITDLTANVPAAIYDYAEAPEMAGVQHFSEQLFAESFGETNPVISPVSAYLALSLAGCGARGETAQVFDAVMGGNLQSVSERLMDALPADSEGTQVLLANSAWVDDRMNCETPWLSIATNSLDASVYQTRLSTEDAKSGINGWVEDNTKGLIPNFLSEPLDDEMRLVLFNTIYFKGKWQSPFEATSTHEWEFTTEQGKSVMVPMMSKYDKQLSYVNSGVCDGIVLPYRDSDLVFVALKPAEGKTVREMCASLTMDQIGSMVDTAQDVQVNLLLPKFEITFDKVLNEDMKHIGLGCAFDKDLADFTGIGLTVDKEPLYIDQVRQKAVFILDEEGTEAAAVTEVAMARVTSIMRESNPLDVYFDRPFLYMILDKETDVPLFMGIMDDPTQAK